MQINKQIEQVIRDTHQKKKHLAFCCISPVIPAKVLAPCQVTIGTDQGVAQAIEKVNFFLTDSVYYFFLTPFFHFFIVWLKKYRSKC
jgi:hypothetical protein